MAKENVEIASKTEIGKNPIELVRAVEPKLVGERFVQPEANLKHVATHGRKNGGKGGEHDDGEDDRVKGEEIPGHEYGDEEDIGHVPHPGRGLIGLFAAAGLAGFTYLWILNKGVLALVGPAGVPAFITVAVVIWSLRQFLK